MTDYPTEYTCPDYFGLKPSFGAPAPYREGIEWHDLDEVPFGRLLQDGDGDYCVRLFTGEFISLGSKPPMWLTEPLGETPFTPVDITTLYEDKD